MKEISFRDALPPALQPAADRPPTGAPPPPVQPTHHRLHPDAEAQAAQVALDKVIRHEGGKYVLYSKDGSKKLGTYDTKAEAESREGQIRRAKHAKNG